MSLLTSKKLMMQGARRIRPQDVFKTSLYAGSGTDQTIATGLDMFGKGGLVWSKSRNNYLGSNDHALIDTVRGGQKFLSSNLTDAEANNSSLTFLSNGYRTGTSGQINQVNGENFVSWSFRRATKFFDIVTYTGDGVSGRQIPHGLGVAPGMIVVKALSSGSSNWVVYHAGNSAPQTKALLLNLNDPASVSPNIWNNTLPTASTFTLGSDASVNGASTTYIAYIFAQNPDLIDCGSYLGNSLSTGNPIVCGKGWRPQWLLIKRAVGGAGNWLMFDAARSPSNPRMLALFANNSLEENSYAFPIDLTSTGFSPKNNDESFNAHSGNRYIYMAIREPY